MRKESSLRPAESMMTSVSAASACTSISAGSVAPVPSAPPPQQRGRLRRHPDHVDAASDSDISVEGGEQSGSDSDSDSDSSVDVPLASLLASMQAAAKRGKRARH